MQIALEYAKWQKFTNVIGRAMNACKNSNYKVEDHFTQVGRMVQTGDSKRKIIEYYLSRYVCYLIVQNADSRKNVVALGQTYFAIQIETK